MICLKTKLLANTLRDVLITLNSHLIGHVVFHKPQMIDMQQLSVQKMSCSKGNDRVTSWKLLPSESHTGARHYLPTSAIESTMASAITAGVASY